MRKFFTFIFIFLLCSTSLASSKIKNLERKEKIILSEIERIDKKINFIERKYESLKKLKIAASKNIKKLKNKIYITRREIASSKKKLRNILKFLYINKLSQYPKIFYQSEIFKFKLNERRYLTYLCLKEKEYIQKLQQMLKKLKEDVRNLKKQEAYINKVIKNIRKEKRNLSSLEKRKKAILRKIRKKKRKLMKISSSSVASLVKSFKNKVSKKDNFYKMKGKLSWPVKGFVISRDKYTKGINIYPKQTKVKAVFDGKVVYSNWFKGYGKLVILQHPDNYYTLYAHLSEIYVKKGDFVKKGTPIGKVGKTGIVDRNLLHFEIRKKDKALNPLVWLR